MKFFGDPDDNYWEDNDDQDGTYFRDREKIPRQEVEEELDWETDSILLKDKMWRAALYLHTHQEMLDENSFYQKTYDRIIDILAKDSITSDDEKRDEEIFFINQIQTLEKEEIEQYRTDALAIVNFINCITDDNT